MIKLFEYAKKKDEFITEVKKTFEEANLKYSYNCDEQDKIRLVFVGQYSAGKSTIISMLTQNEDIQTGEGITTQMANIYNWNGIDVVDTPGVDTRLRPDHDEITYKEIAEADLLVFVITNELFDSYLAEHFRKLAVDQDKAKEMILVVNKMNRTSEGNTKTQQDIIREDLRKVLDPYKPEQFRLTFIDASDYLEGINGDPEDADYYIARSGYDSFVDTLNAFVSEKGTSAKLTSELYAINDFLEKEINKLQPKSDFTEVDALEENFMQQRSLLLESRGRLRQEVSDIFSAAVSRIKSIGLDASNLIIDGCKQDVVENGLEDAIEQSNKIYEECQVQATDVLKERLEEIGQTLNELEGNEFTFKLKAKLCEEFNRLPVQVQRILEGAGQTLQDAGKIILKSAYSAGSNGGLKLTNFSGSQVHNLVLKAGRLVGHKFKPWEAVKFAKGAAVCGQVLSVLGVGLSVFMQIKEDNDVKKHNDMLRDNRMNIRSQFNLAASDLQDYSRNYIETNIMEPIGTSISQIDSNIQLIRDSRDARGDLCRRLEDLQKKCQLLIREIHNEM